MRDESATANQSDDDVVKGEAVMTSRQNTYCMTAIKKGPRTEIHTSLIRALHTGFALVLIHRLFLHCPLLPWICVRHIYLFNKRVLGELG